MTLYRKKIQIRIRNWLSTNGFCGRQLALLPIFNVYWDGQEDHVAVCLEIGWGWIMFELWFNAFEGLA